MDLSEFSEKKEVSFWAAGKPATKDSFANGERVLVKASDGTKQRCTFSKKLIDFLEKQLETGEVAWTSVSRVS